MKAGKTKTNKWMNEWENKRLWHTFLPEREGLQNSAETDMKNEGSSDKTKPSAKNHTKSTFLGLSQKSRLARGEGWIQLSRKSNLIIKFQLFLIIRIK